MLDAVLEGNRQVHAKKRYTARRIDQRLCGEHDFAGSYTIAREYVAREHLLRRKIFIPRRTGPSKR